MAFSQLLREYMGDRSLDEVIQFCEQHGVQIDRTYLSKLRTGARPAPEDENLVRLLAGACNREPAPLTLVARIERRPQEAVLLLTKEQAQVAQATSELQTHHMSVIAGISDVASNGGTIEQVQEYLFNSFDETARLLGVRMGLLQHYTETLRLVGMAIAVPGKALHAAAHSPAANGATAEGRPAEEILIEALATQIKVPAAALQAVVAGLKQIRGTNEGEAAREHSKGT